MADFKFDKNNEKLDFTIGGDLGVGERKPLKPATPAMPKTQPQQPVPTFPQPNNVPQQQNPSPAVHTGHTPLVSRPVITPQTQQPQGMPAQQRPVAPSQPLTARPTTAPQQLPQAPVQPQPVQQHPIYREPVQQQYIEPKYIEPEPVYVEPEYNPPTYQQPQQTFTPQQAQPQPSYAPAYATPAPQQNFTSQQAVEQPSKKKGFAFGGKRKVVLYIRAAIAIVLIIVSIAGVKSIFFPDKFPTQAQVINVVKDDLGVTAFPTDKANGFVIGFIKTYFTYDPENRQAREDALDKYIDPDLLNSTKFQFQAATDGEVIPPTEDTTQVDTPVDQTVQEVPGSKQEVVGEPVIVNINSVDDTNAVFTVEVDLTNGSTFYVEVPIYYNVDTNGMAISAPLAYVPPVSFTDVPNDNHKVTWNDDPEVVKAFKSDLENYLTAWAKSDSTVISRYITTDATLAAKSGLNGVLVFNRVEELRVQAVDDETKDPSVRQAYVTVSWKDANNVNATYTQSYLLVIEQQPDDRWYVKDITGTVISTK